MLSPIPPASAPALGRAVGTPSPCHQHGECPGCGVAPAAALLGPLMLCVTGTEPVPGSWAVAGEPFSGSVGVFSCPHQLVIYKLMELLMTAPEIRASAAARISNRLRPEYWQPGRG